MDGNWFFPCCLWPHAGRSVSHLQPCNCGWSPVWAEFFFSRSPFTPCELFIFFLNSSNSPLLSPVSHRSTFSFKYPATKYFPAFWALSFVEALIVGKTGFQSCTPLVPHITLEIHFISLIPTHYFNLISIFTSLYITSFYDNYLAPAVPAWHLLQYHHQHKQEGWGLQ